MAVWELKKMQQKSSFHKTKFGSFFLLSEVEEKMQKKSSFYKISKLPAKIKLEEVYLRWDKMYKYVLKNPNVSHYLPGY